MPVHSGWNNIFMIPDFNCDMGEGMGREDEILPYIRSASIACGYHAGDMETMRNTILCCMEHQVRIGAHPSFADRENFGRQMQSLTERELYELIIGQLRDLQEIARTLGADLQHVKPHGALYNLSAKDAVTARVIAAAVRDFDPRLVLFGLSGSLSISEAQKAGLQTASEVFADRTYQDDGSLTPRHLAGALINDPQQAVNQVLQMIRTGTVTTVSGNTIPVCAETICIHGDGPNAVELAAAIQLALEKL